MTCSPGETNDGSVSTRSMPIPARLEVGGLERCTSSVAFVGQKKIVYYVGLCLHIRAGLTNQPTMFAAHLGEALPVILHFVVIFLLGTVPNFGCCCATTMAISGDTGAQLQLTDLLSTEGGGTTNGLAKTKGKADHHAMTMALKPGDVVDFPDQPAVAAIINSPNGFRVSVVTTASHDGRPLSHAPLWFGCNPTKNTDVGFSICLLYTSPSPRDRG